MRRANYGSEHERLRETALRFFQKEAVPNLKRWAENGVVDRELFAKAGAIGLLGLQAPTSWGGAGCDSFRYNVVVTEAALSAGFMNIGLRLHTDVVMPYFLSYANDEQKARWLPDLISGNKIAAIAMSEPGTGSDLAGIRTSARRDGDAYLLNGTKTFITNGINADLVVTIARTGHGDDRRSGLSAFVIERGWQGFTRSRPLPKIGLAYSDTAELFYRDVHVPAENLLGEEGMAFNYLTSNLPQERLSVSVGAVAMTRAALEQTVEYARTRQILGRNLSSFQNTRFVLADVSTELEAAEHLIDRGIQALDDRLLSAEDAARIKLFCTEVQGRAVDRCLQIHGGYGCLREYAIAEMYTDARVTRIYGGSSEVMRTIIAKSLGL